MTGLNKGAETRWVMQSPEPGSVLAKIHLFSCSMAALYRGQIHSPGAFSQPVQGLAHYSNQGDVLGMLPPAKKGGH